MSELREKVARAIAIRNYPSGTPSDIEDMAEGFMGDADAAIAAVLEAMQEPSSHMLLAVYGDDDFWNEATATQLWQAMLAAFREEQLGDSQAGDARLTSDS